MIFTALGNDCPWRTQESFPALTTNPKAKAAMPPAVTTKDDHQEVTFLFSASTLQKQSQAVLFHFLTDRPQQCCRGTRPLFVTSNGIKDEQ